jgi:hypothetical protein
VVYIPKDGKARHLMLQDGRSDGVYRSQRYVWAIVFAEKQDGAKDLFSVKKDSTYKGDIAFSRRVLKYEEDPFLNALARVALTKLFSETSVPEKSLADSTNYIQMSELSLDSLQSLYVGTARLGVIDNTQLVLSLYPEGEREFPKGLQSVYTNMVNSSPSWWEIGLATGVSYNRTPTRRVGFSGDTSANKRDTLDVSQRYNTSVLLNLYINVFGRPQLPLRYGAGSIVIGTSVPDLTEDLFLGIGVLTWKGKGGFVAGGLWEKDVVHDPDPANASRVIRREAKFLRPFFGIDLRL